MSCGIGRRCGLDLSSLWLCCRPAAVAPSGPLAWELPYAVGVALKSKKKKKKKKLFCFVLLEFPGSLVVGIRLLGLMSVSHLALCLPVGEVFQLEDVHSFCVA